jgi:hypothetical protein
VARGVVAATKEIGGLRVHHSRFAVRDANRSSIRLVAVCATSSAAPAVNNRTLTTFPLQPPSSATCASQLPDRPHLDTAHASGRHLRGDLDSIV